MLFRAPLNPVQGVCPGVSCYEMHPAASSIINYCAVIAELPHPEDPEEKHDTGIFPASGAGSPGRSSRG
jgi:hypothetical protein